jgi:uncharacterized DUF497 family protein
MAERFVYRFAWDPEKAADNRGKHGVTFEHAATVFRDPAGFKPITMTIIVKPRSAGSRWG